MTTDDLCYLSIAEAANKLRARELSPVELTQAHLDRIQSLDGQLNAYITVLNAGALEQARAAERAFASGMACPGSSATGTTSWPWTSGGAATAIGIPRATTSLRPTS